MSREEKLELLYEACLELSKYVRVPTVYMSGEYIRTLSAGNSSRVLGDIMYLLEELK